MAVRPVDRRKVLKLIGAPLALPLVGSCGERARVNGAGDPWDAAAAIRKRLVRPAIPDRDFSLDDFGGIGDGAADNTDAIARVVAAAVAAGGGRVVVPEGNYRTGPIHLDSGVELHISAGAKLSFIPEPERYLPAVMTRWEGVELMGYSPLIYAFGKTDVAVTGRGIIDGGASDTQWWPWKGPWKGKFENEELVQGPARDRLFADAEAGVPPTERLYADGAYLRPPCLQFYRCDNVLIEDVTIRNSPFWCMNPVLCRSVTVKGVTADSHGPNSDGCNPESCEDVLIEDCLFDTGDDCIAIKSGRNADGRRINVPSRNIVVSNCHMKAGHGGVVMGSELSGGIENVFVENCQMDSPVLDRGIRIKTNAMRGGFVRNVQVRDIEIGFVSELLVVNFFYEEGRDGSFLPEVHDINLSGIACEEVRRVMNVQGFSDAPVSDVMLKDVSIKSVEEPSVIRNIEDFTLENVEIAGRQIRTTDDLT